MLFLLLSFEVPAFTNKIVQNQRCVSHYASKNTFVRAEIQVGVGEHQNTILEVYDDLKNMYFQKHKLQEPTKFVFTTHADAAIKFCVTNLLEQGGPGPHRIRDISLFVDDGASAFDKQHIQRQGEELNPEELELKRYDLMISEVVEEMKTTILSEDQINDINESTLDNLTKFSFLVILVLCLVAGWQVWYLKRYFLHQKLI